MSTSQRQHYPTSPQYTNGHRELQNGSARFEPCDAPDSTCERDFCRVRSCTYCDDEFQHAYDNENKYCSRECKYNGIAYDALRSIRYDHTHCISCFRQLKIVDAPGRKKHSSSVKGADDLETATMDSIPTYGLPDHEGAIDVGGITGVETALPGYHWDVGELFDADPTEGEWEFKPRGLKSTKICECGTAHHATVMYQREDLDKRELIRRAERLCDALDRRIEADQWDHHYDPDVLFDTLRELKTGDLAGQGEDFLILERSLGSSVEAAEG